MSRQIANTQFLLTQDWPLDCYVQGGQGGLVLRSRSGEEPYITPFFFEAFPRNPDTFIRGEGATMEQAEEQAWAKFQENLRCSAVRETGEHAFLPYGYTNGAGFCSACRLFGSKVFTGEQLGQFCRVCGEGTTCSQDVSGQWRCKQHKVYTRMWAARMAQLDGGEGIKAKAKDYPLDPEEPAEVGACLFCHEQVQNSAEGIKLMDCPDPHSFQARYCLGVAMPTRDGSSLTSGMHALVGVEVDTAWFEEDVEIDAQLSTAGSSVRTGDFVRTEHDLDGQTNVHHLAQVLAVDAEGDRLTLKVFSQSLSTD